MTALSIAYLAVAGVVVLLLMDAVRVSPVKCFAIGLALFGLYFASAMELGHPRPLRLAPFGEQEILAYKIEEGKAIFIWTRDDEPMSYRIPYSKQMAKALHEAAKDADREGGVVKGRPSIDGGEMVFHHQPQLPEPPKERAE